MFYVLIAFIVIMIMLGLKKKLFQAMGVGMIIILLGYQIPLKTGLTLFTKVLTNWSSLQILISIYLITFLQRLLNKRDQIKLAKEDLNLLFHNRQINAAGTSFFIGLLPSSAAMILCSDIVKEATERFLDKKDQAFLASWYRHIPESFLPTYTAVLLMSNLSGVSIGNFMLGMIVPVLFLILIGYLFVLRKVPASLDKTTHHFQWKYLISLFQHLWTLLLVIGLILICKISVVQAILITIILAIIIYRFKVDEVLLLLKTSFDKNLLLNTFFVLAFKEFVGYTGVLAVLPELLGQLPIPSYLIFSLLFFFGGIISGSSGIIALGTPIAFASMDGGLPLMILLMCIVHSASQLSPTHVCLSVVSDSFEVSLMDLVRKTLPASLLVCAFAIIYYHLLLLII